MLLRNRLKYALTRKECMSILKERNVLVDGKVRTDTTFPAGFMDVISIPRTGEDFRLLYDHKGRFAVHRIGEKEKNTKLCSIRALHTVKGAVPTATTHDGRTIRYPDPDTKVHDTVVLDLATGKPTGLVKYEVGALVMVVVGGNTGRVGTVVHKERHPGKFEMVQVKDSKGHTFSTRVENVFVIGQKKSLVSLPKAKGVRPSIFEERERRINGGKKQKERK